MSTTIRPEVSEKNKYHVEKHRYYELKHFCLQYDIWVRERGKILGALYPTSGVEPLISNPNYHKDATADFAERLLILDIKINQVVDTARDTDSDLAWYILKAVTEGLSYDILLARYNIPCCKEVYYNLYRKFFWLLSKERE